MSLVKELHGDSDLLAAKDSSLRDDTRLPKALGIKSRPDTDFEEGFRAMSAFFFGVNEL